MPSALFLDGDVCQPHPRNGGKAIPTRRRTGSPTIAQPRATSDGQWHLMDWWHGWESTALDKAATVAPLAADKPPTKLLDWAVHQIQPEATFDTPGVPHPAAQTIGAA